MVKKWYKSLIILFVSFSFFTCIDPYVPNLDKFESLLVVDALLTDDNLSNRVLLTRTMKTLSEKSEKVTGALVIIKDDIGNRTTLTETSIGEYKTDASVFTGKTGRTYILYIKTDDGEEYESDPCLMYPLQDIDSIYFCNEQEEVDNEIQKGIRIYIDSKGESDCRYYRWTFEEWWKFRIPEPELYEYINSGTYVLKPQLRQVCWGNNKSNEIKIKSTELWGSNKFEKKPMLFLESNKTTRFTIQYCIQIKQFSISKKEYEFWDRISQVNESGGDIFVKQPFEVSGNIHNLNKPEEPVLGYFQVSGAKIKRRYLTSREANDLGVPNYYYECDRIERGPDDYKVQGSESALPTIDQIHSEYLSYGYNFLFPVYMNGEVIKLAFATPFCSDCTISGSQEKPDFWVDLY